MVVLGMVGGPAVAAGPSWGQPPTAWGRNVEALRAAWRGYAPIA